MSVPSFFPVPCADVRAQFDCCTRRRQVRIWCLTRTSSLATVRQSGKASHGLHPELQTALSTGGWVMGLRSHGNARGRRPGTGSSQHAAPRGQGRQPACARHAEPERMPMRRHARCPGGSVGSLTGLRETETDAGCRNWAGRRAASAERRMVPSFPRPPDSTSASARAVSDAEEHGTPRAPPAIPLASPLPGHCTVSPVSKSVDGLLASRSVLRG